ncbi:hypothetical protein Ndes2526B_g04963 [Nannochloris sp. 'desiccata']|nr:hypothetical protein KSW81_000345 [Chlorella desiccata (nom. nud.)]KAH7621021.1 hypothetical protein NADE_003630 [Chlorella desiccata (nom. nud.)]
MSSRQRQGPNAWRKLVAFTRRGPLYFAGFAAVAIGLPLYLGDQVMEGTNGPRAENKLEKELRGKASIDAQMLAQAQRERLQVMFDELKDGKGADRYKAALDGQSLGTHSSGSSLGAVSIKIEK